MLVVQSWSFPFQPLDLYRCKRWGSKPGDVFCWSQILLFRPTKVTCWPHVWWKKCQHATSFWNGSLRLEKCILILTHILNKKGDSYEWLRLGFAMELYTLEYINPQTLRLESQRRKISHWPFTEGAMLMDIQGHGLMIHYHGSLHVT